MLKSFTRDEKPLSSPDFKETKSPRISTKRGVANEIVIDIHKSPKVNKSPLNKHEQSFLNFRLQTDELHDE